MGWIKTDKDMSYADGSLHAGITVDSFYTNLNHAYDHSGYYIGVGMFDAVKIEHEFETADQWELVEEFPPIILPVRREKDGDQYNRVRIHAYAKSDDVTVTLRFYALDKWSPVITIDASNPLPDETAYDDETLVTGYALHTWTIRPIRAADVPPIMGVFSDDSDATDGDVEPYDVVVLFLIGMTDNANVNIELTNITIEEVVG